mgnify:CR=1 FL=1
MATVGHMASDDTTAYLLNDGTTLKAEIVGVSRDSVASHDKFKKKFRLPFPLASDAGGYINGTAINGDPSGENDREVETTTIDSIAIRGAKEGRGHCARGSVHAY